MPDENRSIVSDTNQIGRLTPLDRSKELHPWRVAHQLKWCFLYWVPVDFFPIPERQRLWLMAFLDRMTTMLNQRFGLRPEVFLQFKTIYPALAKAFLSNAVTLSPIIGLTRRPGAVMPPPITEDDMKPILEGREKFDFDKFVADYAYWFLNKSERTQRELFFGHGGMTIMFLKPDPKTSPPPLPFTPAVRAGNPAFQKFDIDGLVAQTFALLDGFQKQSKQMFGNGLEDDPQYQGLRFILPLLSTQDFFRQPPEEGKKWFQLFDLYVCESPADKGVIVASALDIQEDLIALVRDMKEEGKEYLER